MATTKNMRLTGRIFHGFAPDGGRKVYNTGDLVPLTERQCKAFHDKFEDPSIKEQEALAAKAAKAAAAEADAEAAKAALKSETGEANKGQQGQQAAKTGGQQ